MIFSSRGAIAACSRGLVFTATALGKVGSRDLNKHNILLAIMLATAASPAALAQSSPAAASVAPQAQAPAAEAEGDASAQVAEIVVTAQRRSENLQSVPISVTALTDAQLQSAGVFSTGSLPSLTPALTLADSVGFLEPKLRGVGNTSAGPGVENSVATYVDGVYIASSPATLLSLNDIDRVEVLKGPQGTLFGRNATGGLIQVVTKDPSQTFGGLADISYGNYDTTRTDLYLTGPITDKIAADLSVSAAHQGEGYMKDPLNGQELAKTGRDITVRSKWLITPSDRTTFRVSMDYEDLSSNDPTIVTIPGTFNAYTPPLNYVPWKEGLLDGGADRTMESGGVSLKADQDLGGVMLTSITAYRRLQLKEAFDADETPAPAIFRRYTQDDEQFSQEIQLTSSHSPSPLQWVIGAYYFHLDSGYDPTTDYHGAPLAPAAITTQVSSETESLAGYAQATYEILPKTNVTAGIRYTHESRTLDAATGTLSGVQTAPVPDALLIPLPHQSIDFNTPTWRLSIDHTFDNELMTYLSYNRGFKSGGYNTQSPTSPPYQPEYLDAYEGGFKSLLFDRKLRLNTSLFLYNYRDIQVNTLVGSTPIIYNGAAARIYGLDGDFEWVVGRDLSFNGGVTLLHDRFTDFPNAVVTIFRPNGSTTTGLGSATGNRLPFAPDAVINVGVDLKHDFSFGGIELSLQEQYNSGYYGSPDNFLKQADFDMLSGTLTYRPAGSSFYFSVFSTNMLNVHVAEFLNSATTGQTIAFGPPLLFGVRAGVKF